MVTSFINTPERLHYVYSNTNLSSDPTLATGEKKNGRQTILTHTDEWCLEYKAWNLVDWGRLRKRRTPSSVRGEEKL